MKKLLIIILLISGCAHKPYMIPSDILTRLERINIEVSKCIQGEYPIYVSSLKKPNAWLNDGKVYLTEGLFEFNDDTLKFVMSHEIAHSKLGHIREKRAVNYATTGVMLVLNTIIPGTGFLNWVVNPAIVNNFSKKQEFEADLEALSTCECMGISKERVIIILRGLKKRTLDGGGFWDQHPSWDERIRNIE